MSELPRFVLGIDPGKRSGVALFDLLYETCVGSEVVWENFGVTLEMMIKTYRPAVVAEAFVINAATIRNSSAPWSLNANGVADYLSRKYGCPYEVQSQSSAKRFSTNDRLDALGWRKPGQGHLADAQRQVLLYLVRNGWWDTSLDVA